MFEYIMLSMFAMVLFCFVIFLIMKLTRDVIEKGFTFSWLLWFLGYEAALVLLAFLVPWLARSQ